MRTVAQVPLTVVIKDTCGPPKYQRLAPKVQHLRQLGLSYRKIARELKVDTKLVRKAEAWINSLQAAADPGFDSGEEA